jgi:hypothetical protein
LKAELYEVWGDTIDSRHLMYSIAIGAVISLTAFFGAKYLLVGWVENVQMARAYAMLVGIVGCLLGGAVSAKLFKPKRHVLEHQADPAWRAKALVELQNEFGDLGKLSDLPAATIAELREMDLYQLFADYEKSTASASSAQAQQSPDEGAFGAPASLKGGRS